PAPSVQFEARGYFLQFFLLLSVLTLLFISTGVASIRLRRWARPIIISFAGLFIFSALVMLLQFLVPTIASQLMATPPAQRPANHPPVVAHEFAEDFLLCILALACIAIPLLFIFAYRAPSVRLALEEHDPCIPWTERVP